jgi:hypothetical protein
VCAGLASAAERDRGYREVSEKYSHVIPLASKSSGTWQLSQLAVLGHKVLQDFGECVYTKHDERHTRFIELQDLNVDQSARSQLNFGPPGGGQPLRAQQVR